MGKYPFVIASLEFSTPQEGRGARFKIVASRWYDLLRASTSAVRQADRLRGAAHPVVNIRTSEHHILSRPRLSVRMFGSWGKKRANASSKCAAR